MDVILLRTDEKLTWNEISGYMGCLSPHRRVAVEKKAQDADKINTLLSRLLIISEIKRRTGLSEKKISFTLGSFGKPYLKGGELQFSMSHTRGAVCAAFADEEIGVDAERRDRTVKKSMYNRVLTDEEQKAVHSDEDFIRFWVQKEAFLKRLGVGITRDLRGVNSLTLPDTKVFDNGEFFIAVSGNGAQGAQITEITVNELLGRFTKLC